MAMTWLSHPPASVHTAEDELPNHHGESGLIWEAFDGSIWMSQRTRGTTVTWIRAHPDHEDTIRRAHPIPLPKRLIEAAEQVIAQRPGNGGYVLTAAINDMDNVLRAMGVYD